MSKEYIDKNEVLRMIAHEEDTHELIYSKEAYHRIYEMVGMVRPKCYSCSKPCPFCDGKADWFVMEKMNNEKLYYVECSYCFARTGYYFTEYESIKEWNKRTPDWISVNDRLPEREEAVVVLTEGMELLVANIDEKFDYWFHEEGILSMSYVTHWLPIPELPEPPTLEGDE